MMRVVIKRPGKLAVVETIEPGLEALQAAVGGPLEILMKAHEFFDEQDHLVCYGDEEGRLKDAVFNILRPSDGTPLVGPIVAVKTDGAGDDVSMTEEDAQRSIELLGTMSMPGDE